MNRFLRLLITLILISFLTGVIATPASAWLWSNTATVVVRINPKPNGGILPVNVIDCRPGATLSGNGRVYTAVSVTNPWLSNKCEYRFNKVYVGNGLRYSLRFSYKYYFQNYSRSVSVYVKRPTGATFTTPWIVYTP